MYGRTRPIEWVFAIALLVWGVALGLFPAGFHQPGFAGIREHWGEVSRFTALLCFVGAIWLAALAYNGKYPAPLLRALMAACGASIYAETAYSFLLTAWRSDYVSPLGLVLVAIGAACLYCVFRAVRDVRFIH